MSVVRRLVVWALVIAVVGACALLAPAVGVTSVDSAVHPPALIPGFNSELPGTTQATAGQGYADYPKGNDNVGAPVELSFPREDMRHLATVSVDKSPALSANRVTVSNLVGLRMAGSKQALNAVGLVPGQASGTSDRVRSLSPVAGTQIPTGSAVKVPPVDPIDPGNSGDTRQPEETSQPGGSNTDGPSTEGPSTEGPSTEGPSTEGPSTEGPST
ncbi:MAG: PASTA domain-containing protein, partial [Pseudonocardiaceae bacterium]